jgi:integrase
MAIRQKGNKWQVDVTIKGIRAPRVSADTRAEAQVIEADFRAKLMRGVPPEMLASPTGKVVSYSGTLGELIDIAHRTFWRGAKSEITALRNAEAWSNELGRDFPATGMTSDKIAAICDGWGAGGNAPGTINRKLAALRVMLKLAVERDMLAKMPRIPVRKEYEGRLRYFSEAEEASLIEYATVTRQDPEMGQMMSVGVASGLRLGELLRLTKRDFDEKNRQITLWETKGDRARTIPLTFKATAIMVAICKTKMDHELIFDPRLTSRNISRVMDGWKQSLGIPKDDEACFHSFRHTTCSRLVQRGVPLPVVQRFMGHADISTTMRYAHLAPDSLDLARNALEGTSA